VGASGARKEGCAESLLTFEEWWSKTEKVLWYAARTDLAAMAFDAGRKEKSMGTRHGAVKIESSLDEALADACRLVLESEVATKSVGTPYPFSFPRGAFSPSREDDAPSPRFHISVRVVGDDTRVEYALGNLYRTWSLVLDATAGMTDLGKAAVLLALHEVASWTYKKE